MAHVTVLENNFRRETNLVTHMFSTDPKIIQSIELHKKETEQAAK